MTHIVAHHGDLWCCAPVAHELPATAASGAEPLWYVLLATAAGHCSMAGRGCRCCSATHVKVLPPRQQSHREPCAAVLRQNVDTATAAPQVLLWYGAATAAALPPLLRCPHCITRSPVVLPPLLRCHQCCAAPTTVAPAAGAARPATLQRYTYRCCVTIP